MNITQQIVTISIHLTQNRGTRLSIKNLNGFVEIFNDGELEVMYSIPFSGAEVYPGQKPYMVDIWHNRKKVFSIYYSNFGELNSSEKSPRGDWIDKLIALKLD